jgi:multidrug efflux pump subunit AcrA (membrane-fusion protein)
MKILKFISFILVLISISCTNNNKDIEDSKIENKSNDEIQKVEIVEVFPQVFYNQIIANGKLSAVQKAEIKFKTSGTLNKILVKNGDRVKKNQTIAVIENTTQNLEIASAKDALDNARIELNSLIIGYGGKQNDTLSVPIYIYENLKIQSMYNSTLNSLQKAKLNFSYTICKVPFNGIIGNLSIKNHNFINSSDDFCTIINDKYFEVEYSIIETEAPYLSLNQTVQIIPFSDEKLKIEGKISEINPMVDDDGLINIKALIKNPANNFLDGMNVKVIIKTPVKNQLVIPKEALVLRSNREVVFTYKNQLAKWNYVTIAYENSNTYAILEGINAGDSVIYKGNLNLAHDAKVVLNK